MKQAPDAALFERLAGDKLITCILPQGTGHDVLVRLKTEKEVVACVLNSARGVGISTPNEKRNLGPLSEKDVLQVVTPPGHADDLFEWIYFAAGVDKPHGGFMYVNPLTAATSFFLPDVLPELK